MSDIHQLLVYVHAALGGLALLSGALALVARKGGVKHKTGGRVFFYCMSVSTLLSLLMALMPGHGNPFLFAIGVFTLYLLWSGFRGLRFRRRTDGLWKDKLVSRTMVLTGAAMCIVPLVRYGNIDVVLLVFGLAAMVFGVRDLRMFGRPQLLEKNWLKIHIGKMTGGYIAAVSAFLVVNGLLPNLLNWFLPSVLGSLYIGYWIRRTAARPDRNTKAL